MVVGFNSYSTNIPDQINENFGFDVNEPKGVREHDLSSHFSVLGSHVSSSKKGYKLLTNCKYRKRRLSIMSQGECFAQQTCTTLRQLLQKVAK